MKITNAELKQIIKEELDAVMNESAMGALVLGGLAMAALHKWMNKKPSRADDYQPIDHGKLESDLIEAGFKPEPNIDWRLLGSAFSFHLYKPGELGALIRLQRQYRADTQEEAQQLALGHAIEQFQDSAREENRKDSQRRMARGEESITIDDPMMERKRRK